MIVSSDNGGVMDDGYADGAVEDAHGHKCNGPLRGYKGSLWEGGHREPLIVRWPGRVKRGGTSGELIGLVDMMASFAAAAGVEMPADGGPDSFNVLPALLGGKSPRDHLVVQSNGTERQAIRVGAWKYIPGKPGAKAGGGIYGTSPNVQLYNLADDFRRRKQPCRKTSPQGEGISKPCSTRSRPTVHGAVSKTRNKSWAGPSHAESGRGRSLNRLA